MHHAEHEYEDETLSLTREQIRVLRGRKLADLDVRERVEYANAAPRPFLKSIDSGLLLVFSTGATRGSSWRWPTAPTG